MLRSFKLTIAYDGTNYAGWQVQPDQPTIQSELQKALKRVTKQDVQAIGSGRTDSGVHATAQAASCQIRNWNASASDLTTALNCQLPDDIVVTESVDAPLDFHAIRDATGKRYRYQIQLGGKRNVFRHRFHWHYKFPIEIEPMIDAASRFIGQQDFASFQASGAERKSTTRTVRACDLIDESTDQYNQIALEIEANGFLYNMVRNIVGTIVEVGRGKESPTWIDDVIAAKDRDAAGPTAPPQGLFLIRVDYPSF